jgi:competence protein ComEA
MTEHEKHWRWATPPVNGAARTGDGSAHALGGVETPAATGSSPRQDGSRHSPLPPVDGVGRTGDGSAHGLGGVEVPAVTDSSPKRDGSRHSLLPPVLTARARWKAALTDRLPPTLHGRWAIDRTTGIVLAVSVLLGALLIGGWAVLRARPHEMAVSRDRPLGFGGGGEGSSYPQAAPADSPQVDSLPTVPVSLPPNSGSGIGGGSGAASASVIVDVEGKVAKPGVRTLPAGSRILDALNAAGGALPGTDLTSLNQAQVLVDGEQVLVGVTPPPQDDAGSASGHGGKGKKGHGSGGPGSVEPVHLNTATVDDLEGLPGIGPALAQRVVDYRTQHGPFHSVDELRQVSGFGGQRYENLASMIAL